ncbi:MAG: bifunctional ornithine acetyltransferase/N-acetylglutamate synthase [Clostridium fessum]
MFGSDANWGRVLCAMGYSGAAFNTEKAVSRVCLQRRQHCSL